MCLTRKEMNKKKLFLIALSSGVLMSLAWVNVMMFAPLILISFIPLLWVEDYISNNNDNKTFSNYATFRYSFFAFLIFNFSTTYWISYASIIAIVIPVFEATLMSVVFQIYHYTTKNLQYKKGKYLFLIFFWILFETIQLHWDLNFPWLNLGNTFACYPILVQWYSVLGVEGGSVWILLSNITLYLLIRKIPCLAIPHLNLTTNNKRLFKNNQELVFALIVVCLPILLSCYLWFSYKDTNTNKQASIVVIQPNLDPYQEQYSLSPSDVVKRIETLATPLMDDSVDYVVCPESCIQEYAWEDQLNNVNSINSLRLFSNKYKKAEFIAGMSSERMLEKGVITDASRKYENGQDQYYESCNISLDINRDTLNPHCQIYHKSILTAGVEKMPFKKYMPFVEKLALDFGGTIGSLGIDSTAVAFHSQSKDITVGTPICYESVDGNYVREFVKNGANVLFVITNDGWWGNTAGYKHHFAFSALRAIENRRYIARSANTGYSGFFSPRGQTLMKTPYWQEKAIKMSVPLLNNQTFFTKYGDIIMKPFSFIAVLIFIYTITQNIINKKKRTNP